MKISVFTPSHDTRFLDEAYESLLAQTHEDWEWEVLLNGPAAEIEDGAWGVDDSRVHIRFLKGTHGIGELKMWACTTVTGKVMVELDHDDILASTALERIAEAFEANPEASLVYSDFAQISEDGGRDDGRFDPRFGWEYTDDEVDGRSVLRCFCMHHYPSTVSYIWYAPNHVRAFRTEAYRAVGGYDSNLDVLDDQDLMSRLYQYGEFVYIDECLYLQRVHPNNTQAKSDLNARIQQETLSLYDRYIDGNASAWAIRNDLQVINLANHRTLPLPFEDGSVGVIRAIECLSHVTDKVALMNECYRVLAHGGMMMILVPSSDGRGAYQDPTHVSYWNENSFWYYSDLHYAKYVPEINCRFQNSRTYTTFPSAWHEQHDISYVVANLVAIKDGPRIAGELLI